MTNIQNKIILILSWENGFMCKVFGRIMGLFSSKKEMTISNICPKCNMTFSDPERTLRHIAKAHKPKKKFECNSCG
jgi:hypothetical protein